MTLLDNNNINLSPLTDFGFRKLLGQEATKDLMIDFLNALLHDEEKAERIVEIDFLNTDPQLDGDEMRRYIFDIYCLTESGRHIIIEIERRAYANFHDRMTAYSANAVITHLERRRDKFFKSLQEKRAILGWPATLDDLKVERELKKEASSYELESVYVVAICDFIFDRSRPRIKLSEGRCDLETRELIDDRQRFIYIQLPYFTKMKEECVTALDQWLYTFKHLPTMRQNPFAGGNNVFERLMAVAGIHNLNEAERIAYQRELDDYIVAVEVEDHIRREGRAEGRAEGMAEGRAKGVEEGANKKLVQIIKSMRANGLDNPTIARLLNESPEFVASI